MKDLQQIKAKMQVHVFALQTLGLDLASSLEPRHGAVALIAHHSYVVETVLRSLWQKTGRKGSPSKKNLEVLLQELPACLRERQIEIPGRIETNLRNFQNTRNFAIHHPAEATMQDAETTMGLMCAIVCWYFEDCLPKLAAPLVPEHVQTPTASTHGAELQKEGWRIAIFHERRAKLDEELLTGLKTRFRASGHQVFVDRGTITGEKWGKEIGEQIRAADAVIVLLSAASVGSEMLLYETQLARETAQSHGKPRLLGVRVNYLGPFPEELDVALGAYTCHVWTSAQDDQKLFDELAHTLSEYSLPASSLKTTRVVATFEHDGGGQKKRESTRRDEARKLATFEQDGGAVPLDSRFYVVRPVDDDFLQAMSRRDSILLIKGARQMGKTSLLSRGLVQARDAGLRVVRTDFQALNASDFHSAKEFYLALGNIIADQLDLEKFPHEIWREPLNANANFERYLRRELLKTEAAPVVWAMDEVDRLFVCPFASDVFGLFRSWHNARALDPGGAFSRLTMAIVYATEAHLFISDLNQSPFNVGTRLTLEDFTLSQVVDLNRRYGAPLADENGISQFFRLFGGQPYLTRRGLRELADRRVDLMSLEAQANREEGLFSDHLRRILVLIAQDNQMVDAVRRVLRGQPCLDHGSFFRLRSAGVFAGDRLQDARVRCQFYTTYLKNHLL